MTRRQFGVLLGAGVMMMLPRVVITKANLSAEVEVYAGSAHGWCPPDSRVYNEAQAEKAWSRLLALYGKALA